MLTITLKMLRLFAVERHVIIESLIETLFIKTYERTPI